VSPATERWRFALFWAACAALFAAALGFTGDAQPPAPTPMPAGSVAAPPEAPSTGGAPGLRAAVDRAALRFLAAFFHYEVGELGPGVRRALRAAATPGFVAELLSAPPRGPPRRAPAAVLGRLSIAVVSVAPPRALISGFARRGHRPEPFSFLFEARDGAWLASGAGE
jgi:hypothetical protein